MRDYNVVEALYLSFYSPALYRNVATKWGGKAFLYLLFIVALSWVLFTIQVQHGISLLYKADSNKIASQIPIITIKNGIISTPENRPYLVYSPDHQSLLGVIDTSGHYTTLQNAKSMMLVTSTTIYTQNDAKNLSDVRERQIPNTVNMIINPTTINSHIIHFIPFAWLFIFSTCVVAGFVYRFIQVFFYAVIGRMIGGIFNLQLNYWQVLQVAMVSLTPVLTVSVILDAMNLRIPHESFFFFLLAMVYLIFGMFANAANE